MTKIDEILTEIRMTTGIIRQPVKLSDPDIAVQAFIRIADAMLEWKGRRFNADAVRDEMMALIGWTYLLDDSLDYTKGILFKGNTGVGKTFLFQVWRKFLKIDGLTFISNGRRHVLAPVMANCRAVAAEFAESTCGGSDVIRKYAAFPCLILDDIGAEPSVQSSFGNRTSVISEIIDRRNESSLLTFGTTNLHRMLGSSQEDGYDARTARRMGELFNVKAVRGGFSPDKEIRKTR